MQSFVCTVMERQTKIEPINFLKPKIPAYLLENWPQILAFHEILKKNSSNHRSTQSPYQSFNVVDMLLWSWKLFLLQFFVCRLKLKTWVSTNQKRNSPILKEKTRQITRLQSHHTNRPLYCVYNVSKNDEILFWPIR